MKSKTGSDTILFDNCDNHIDPIIHNGAAPRLLDQMRGKIRLKHYSLRTKQSYTDWIKRFIRHFDKANHALTIKLVMCADTRIE